MRRVLGKVGDNHPPDRADPQPHRSRRLKHLGRCIIEAAAYSGSWYKSKKSQFLREEERESTINQQGDEWRKL